MTARRLTAALLLLGLPLAAEMKMTVDQLVSFVRSSRQLGHSDKQVAEYLRQVKLSSQLPERVIEDLQGTGAGPKTLEALKALRTGALLLSPPPALAAKVIVAPIAPPSALEQGRILDAVRDYALSYTRRLPDFLCTQVTRRYYDPAGLEVWHLMDTVVARLGYAEQREDYKVVLVNNQPVSVSQEQLGGAVSSGEFGSLMREIFEPGTQAHFEWERWATLRGRRTHVFSYLVDQSKSKWRIRYEQTQEIVPAYRGVFYVDPESNAVLRVTLEAVDVPPAFPIQQAGTVLDYDRAEIAGQSHMLPLKAVVRMRQGKLLTRNDIEFRQYRKFTTEATITLVDTPEPLPEEKVGEQPATPSAPPKR